MRVPAWLAASAVVLAALAPAPATPVRTVASPAIDCHDHRIPVGSGAARIRMWGRMCTPSSADTALVLVPGATYDHVYWDVPTPSGRYSFRAAANAGGYATLAVDRVGTGRSTVPPSSAVSLRAEADQLHDVVDALRHGRLDGRPYRRIVLVGHSKGSSVIILEAAAHRDVDALLVTGLLHRSDARNYRALGATEHPARADPQLAGRPYDAGYLTTLPGTRARSFYGGRDDVSPRVAAIDERTKDITTRTESADPLAFDPRLSRSITSPVMLAVGGHDPLFCTPAAVDCAGSSDVRREERPYWTGTSSLSA